MRILIFPGYFLPHVGGLETHVDEFVKYLSKDKKYRITIFVPNIPFSKEKEIIHNNVKVIRYPAFELISNWPLPKFWSLKFWKLFFGLYSKDYDIVMTRTRFFTNSFVGLFFAKFRLKRIKLIHVEHGSDFVKLESKFKSYLSYIYDKIFGKLIFKCADKNIAISKAVYNFVCKNFVNCKKEKVPIIRRGVDFEIYNNIKSNKEIKQKFKNKIVICFLGRLYKWKGVSNSIKAYKELLKYIKENVVFLVVGYGEDEDRLKKLAGKDLDNGIYFLGKKDFKEAISILKSSDIYVHSAYPGGGLSNSLLQAMYCGCSVVASPNEGANEVVFDSFNGVLLKNNSPKLLKEGIEKLIKNEGLRKKYSKNASDYIKQNFSWEKVINDYEKVFSEVLEDGEN